MAKRRNPTSKWGRITTERISPRRVAITGPHGTVTLDYKSHGEDGFMWSGYFNSKRGHAPMGSTSSLRDAKALAMRAVRGTYDPIEKPGPWRDPRLNPIAISRSSRTERSAAARYLTGLRRGAPTLAKSQRRFLTHAMRTNPKRRNAGTLELPLASPTIRSARTVLHRAAMRAFAGRYPDSEPRTGILLGRMTTVRSPRTHKHVNVQPIANRGAGGFRLTYSGYTHLHPSSGTHYDEGSAATHLIIMLGELER